jgi:hypothetical protein
MAHPLHKAIGGIVTDNLLPGYEVLKDPACGGKQNVPLFCSDKNLSKNEYCNVDLLVVKSNKIKVIIEIEEANIKPIQICGKFLTSALSSFYIHENKVRNTFKMDEKVLFIQILDTSKLKEGTNKIEQWENIEGSIKKIIPTVDSKIKKYKLFYGKVSEFRLNGAKRKKLIGCIRNFLDL